MNKKKFNINQIYFWAHHSTKHALGYSVPRLFTQTSWCFIITQAVPLQSKALDFLTLLMLRLPSSFMPSSLIKHQLLAYINPLCIEMLTAGINMTPFVILSVYFLPSWYSSSSRKQNVIQVWDLRLDLSVQQPKWGQDSHPDWTVLKFFSSNDWYEITFFFGDSHIILVFSSPFSPQFGHLAILVIRS